MSFHQTLTALTITALFSAIGAFFLFISDRDFEKLTPFLISLAAGTIFGGVFIHLVFRLANKYSYGRETGLLIIAGMIASFFLERVVHWHCHHTGRHEEPLPYVLAAGDSVHNLLDGVLIATSFLASTPAGIASTIAIIAHKIPKELGDFGVMVDSGFSQMKALGVNIGISVFMFLGAALVFALSQVSAATVPVLLPLVIGNFVFIAGSDLLPEFKTEDRWGLHLVMFGIGVAIMYAIPYIKAAV